MSAGLPTGLRMNSITGAITGTPTGLGHYSGIVTATNTYGSGSSNLSFLVNPTVTFGKLNVVYNGSPEPASVKVAPAGLLVTVTYNGSTTPPHQSRHLHRFCLRHHPLP